MKFQNVKFIKTVVQIEDLPFFADLPEIAVVGRSNVGKSSLLNHLFGSKDLVKTSSTPGKTRALNFFNVDSRLICVDMPGYGYAERWSGLIENYLTQRLTLKLLLFLFDIRRIPSEGDLHMLEWIRHHRLPTILVLTKVDKVSQSEKHAQTKRITDRLYQHLLKLQDDGIKDLPYVHYSTTKNEGRKELTTLLNSTLYPNNLKD